MLMHSWVLKNVQRISDGKKVFYVFLKAACVCVFDAVVSGRTGVALVEKVKLNVTGVAAELRHVCE